MNANLKPQIEKEFAETKNKYPKLSEPETVNEYLVIQGAIDVIDETGKNWGDYNVRIVILPDYPSSPPKLFETGGKIKREKDWHINTDGTCCLGPRGKEIQLFTNGGSLITWIDSFVFPFLANHTLKNETGEYANKEYSHGAKGILEFYQDEWGMKDEKLVLQTLQTISGQRMSRNQKCFCGSSKKYKHCHEAGAAIYKGIPINTYRKDLSDIQFERNKLAL